MTLYHTIKITQPKVPTRVLCLAQSPDEGYSKAGFTHCSKVSSDRFLWLHFCHDFGKIWQKKNPNHNITAISEPSLMGKENLNCEGTLFLLLMCLYIQS